MAKIKTLNPLEFPLFLHRNLLKLVSKPKEVEITKSTNQWSSLTFAVSLPKAAKFSNVFQTFIHLLMLEMVETGRWYTSLTNIEDRWNLHLFLSQK